MPSDPKPHYPMRKQRELSKNERVAIRARLATGQTDARILAAEFACSPGQIAGIKAQMSKQQSIAKDGQLTLHKPSEPDKPLIASSTKSRFELTLMHAFDVDGMTPCEPPSVAVPFEKSPQQAVAGLWRYKKAVFVRITWGEQVVHAFASDRTDQPWTQAAVQEFAEYMSNVLRLWVTDAARETLYAEWNERGMSIVWDKDSRFPPTPAGERYGQHLLFSIRKMMAERPSAVHMKFTDDQERDAYAAWLKSN